MEREISKTWVYLRRLSSFSDSSYFGHDHRDLDIARKNDGDGYSKMSQCFSSVSCL